MKKKLIKVRKYYHQNHEPTNDQKYPPTQHLQYPLGPLILNFEL